MKSSLTSRMINRFVQALAGIGILTVFIYILGPRANFAVLDSKIAATPFSIEEVASYVTDHESSIANIKTGNEAKIFWADSADTKTKYALVYLHGFSASHGEGDPVHREFARRYGMNLFLARLHDHGLDEKDALLDVTPTNLLQSAKKAIVIGKSIGERVIVMSCSTGSTLALYLAAHNPDWIDGLICFSPNIDLKSKATHLIDGPWGKQILRLAEGGDYHQSDAPDAAQSWWTTSYRIESLIALRNLLDQTMTNETFAAMRQPVQIMYYYRSEEEQDEVVSVTAMHDMFNQLGTTSDEKKMIAIPEAERHVFVSKYYDSNLTSVRKELYSFAEGTFGLTPIANL